jgi:hypothetical protein
MTKYLACALGLLPLLVACAPRRDAPAFRRVPAPAGELRVRVDEDALRFTAPDPSDAAWLAEVVLPAKADAETRIVDRASGVRVGVRLEGARPAPARLSGAAVTYTAAMPHAGDVTLRPSLRGAEDFVTILRKPAHEAVVYAADVSSAAGLRLVGNVLELLDASGAPRLRMAAPSLVDRRGRRFDAKVALTDCAADASGAAPWGRPVTPPGRARCAVSIEWTGATAEYPVVLDPSWASTKGNMIAPRRGHTATLLSDGTVLIVGGAPPTGQKAPLLTAELFDPKTGTFAMTGSLSEGRASHVAVLLKSGKVLLTSGAGQANPVASTELYESGKFRVVGALHTARSQAAATLLSSGQVLIAGGINGAGEVTDSTELFDPTMEMWTPAPSMNDKRIGHYLTTLSNTGSGLAVAGITTTTVADLVDCEFFTASLNKWTTTAALAEPRSFFGAATLTDGSVLVSGGYDASRAATTDGVEIFDASKQTWSKTGKLAAARTEHTLTALSGGSAVAAGGIVRNGSRAITEYLKSVEAYDPAAKAWSSLPDMKQARSGHTATLLADGRVLVAGGDTAQGATATAELLSLDAKATACKVGATCATGFCVDGVCCESACDTACNACILAGTGKPDGTCALAQAGKDPHDDCKDDGAPTCKKDGLCDGAGACEDYPSTKCTPSACAMDEECSSGFCADGVCCDTACSGDCQACTKTKKGSGSDGTCGPVAKGMDPDKDCGTLGKGVCKGAGTCDGSGACRAETEGKDCAPEGCSDTVTLARAATCNAAGDCAPDTLDCTPFLCDAKAVACTTTCVKDADCATGAHCSDGACAKSGNGTACKDAVECTSGFCADGYCCDKACSGQCEACDGSGTEGTCKPVSGDPANGRKPCDGSGPCAGSCTGTFGDSCDYPHNDEVCNTGGTCTDGMETASRCNGSGLCVETPRDCAPFACDAEACRTSCTKDGDCTPGVHCDENGQCTPGIALTCSGDDAVSLVDGGVHGCGAYKCVNTACNTSCKADDDCAGGASCKSGKCEASDSGCGCRIGSLDDRRGAGSVLAVGLAAVLLRLRRRSQRKETPDPPAR